MMQEKLSTLRCAIDELYDCTQPHSSVKSQLFLEINQQLDELQKEVREMSSNLFDYMFSEDIEFLNAAANSLGLDVKTPSKYVKGEDLDWNNKELVEDLMKD